MVVSRLRYAIDYFANALGYTVWFNADEIVSEGYSVLLSIVGK